MKRAGFGLGTLLAFDLILFAPLLATGGVFSSHDFVRAHHPWRQTARGVLETENRLLSDPAASGQTTLVRYRRFPEGLFWNPWVASGAMGPFLLAQGFLSPFVALPALLLPEAGIETGILFLKFNFAFLAAYAFLRSRRFSDRASAAGAAAWAFSTGQTVWGLWMQSSVSVTFPLLLMAVDRAFDSPRSARAIRFATLAFLLTLSGGFPHWILFGGICAALWFAVRTAGDSGRAVRAAGRLAVSAAIALAILLPPILATARFLRSSDYASLRRGMGSDHALPLRHARLYALPDYYGTPRQDDYRGIGWIPGDNFIETAAGIGVAAAGLALIGVSQTRRRREALYAAILAGTVALPLYAGGALLRGVGSLPLLDIGLFARAKILILFAAGILAACGVELLERLARGGALRTAAAGVLPFLIAVPLAFCALDFYPVSAPDEAVFAETEGIRKLREATSGGGRFAAAGWTLIPNVSEALGIEDVRGHFLLDAGYRRLLSAADPNAFGAYGTYLVFDPRSLDPSSPVLDLLDVRVLAAPPGAASPVGEEVASRDGAPFVSGGGARPPPPAAGGLARIYAGEDMTLFARPGALPRFRLVGEALSGGIEETRGAGRDTLARAAHVQPARSAGAPGLRADGRLRVLESRPERFALEVETAGPTLLATSQRRFSPYWRMWLDGRPAGSVTVNGLFLGLEIPAGRHRVEGRFVVPRAELAASLAGLAALCAILVAAASGHR